MDMNFLKPDKQKLSKFGILIIALVGLIFTPLSLFFINFVPWWLMLIVGIISAYYTGCWLSSKAIIKLILIYISIFFTTLIVIGLFIIGYNNSIGRYCNEDSDCIYKCGEGPQNKHYLRFETWSSAFCSIPPIICENHRCIKFRMEEPKSVEDCENIDNRSGMVKESCLIWVARNTNDSTICNLIQDKSTREGCITSNSYNPNDCMNFTDSRGRDNCLWKTGIRAGNLSVCNIIENGAWKHFCRKGVIIKRNMIELCDEFKKEDRDECKGEIAENLLDKGIIRLDICDDIETISIKDFCYWDISKATNNPDLCRKLYIEPFKVECLQEFEN